MNRRALSVRPKSLYGKIAVDTDQLPRFSLSYLLINLAAPRRDMFMDKSPIPTAAATRIELVANPAKTPLTIANITPIIPLIILVSPS